MRHELAHDGRSRRKSRTLLLIDDDLVSREVMATVLTLRGHTVHTVSDGAAALELLAAGGSAPDVILVDVQMPGLSGEELIRELRARSQARIIGISGSEAPAEVRLAADGFLLKPFGAEALEKLLNLRQPTAARMKAEAPDTNVPVVNTRILAQLREMMPESAVREIYVAVVNDLTRRLQALEVAIAEGDADEVHRIGHSIKGGCGMAGAMQAARLGALLEGFSIAPMGNQLDNSSALLLDLRAAVLNLERILEAGLPQ